MVSEIPDAYFIKAAEYWANFLPTDLGKKPTGKEHLSNLALDEGDEAVPYDIIQFLEKHVDNEFKKDPGIEPDESLKIRNHFISRLAYLIKFNGKRYPGSATVRFGDLSSYEPPKEVTFAAETLGLDVGYLQFPAKTETTIYPNGIIERYNCMERTYEYAGEGIDPVMLDEAEFDKKRIAKAPAVIAAESEMIYTPVKEGDTYIDAIVWHGQPEYRTRTAEHGGFVYTKKHGIKEEHIEEVIENPKLLLDNPELFTDISFCSSDPEDIGHFLYEYFATPAGKHTKLYYEPDSHVMMPNNRGFAVNDGNGHVLEYAGPYRLLTVGSGEKYMNSQLDMVLADEGGHILYDTSSGRGKIIDQELADRYGINVFLYKDGKLIDPPVIEGNHLFPLSTIMKSA